MRIDEAIPYIVFSMAFLPSASLFAFVNNFRPLATITVFAVYILISFYWRL